MILCTSCWERKCTCENKKYAQIDDEIADIIILLNGKGYVTRNCCAGHNNSKKTYTNIYIQFNEVYDFKSVPKGFQCETQVISNNEKYTLISHFFSFERRNGNIFYKDNIINLDNELDLYREELREWAYKLNEMGDNV